VNAVAVDAAVGNQANAQALDAIIKARETYSIVAPQDMVDVRGLKLWAKGQPVCAARQQRLLERKQQPPLDACLAAEEGVTLCGLHHDLKAWLDSGSSIPPSFGISLSRLIRLLVSRNVSGCCRLDGATLGASERFELEMADKELKQRLRELQRECILLSERRGEGEKLRLQPLWQDLIPTASA
jgi:hypothetical protein